MPKRGPGSRSIENPRRNKTEGDQNGCFYGHAALYPNLYPKSL